MAEKYASGAIFLNEYDGKLCLFKRSNSVDEPHTYGPVGGMFDSNNDETIIDTLKREIYEETGFTINKNKIFLVNVDSNDEGLTYYTFLVIIYIDDYNNFYFNLNEENENYIWFHMDEIPTQLHPYCKITFQTSKRLHNVYNYYAH